MGTDEAPKLPTVRLLDFLLDLANRAGIPPKEPKGDHLEHDKCNTLFPVTAKREYHDGVMEEAWKVAVFYDGGMFDYIDSFITPSGAEIDCFEFPWQSEEYQALVRWTPSYAS